MFDSLSSKLQKITSGMRGKARVTDQDINDIRHAVDRITTYGKDQ